MVKADKWRARTLVLALGVLIGAGDARAEPPEASAVPNPPQADVPQPGERRIALKHHWTREQLDIVYRIGETYQPEAMAAINHLLRDYRCQKQTTMDPKLIDLIWELQQELSPRGPVRIVSAYRSEGYNASLLRAGRTVDPDSQHTFGRAADVIFPGVKADQVRAAAEAKGLGGVGYYPFSGPVFVHVDTGPLRHWVERDPREARALAPRRRGRMKLDCSLTIEQALVEVSPMRAYGALPDGASTKPHPIGDLLQTSFQGLPRFTPLPAEAEGEGEGLDDDDQDGDGPVCQGHEPLAPLAVLTASVKPAQPRLRARAVHKAKVARQVKSARRSARKGKRAKMKRLTTAGRSRKK
jgi:uncharacterized protein YcbK (DUF882 family)